MCDPLAEPRTTPVRFRRRPVPERLRLLSEDLMGMAEHDRASLGIGPIAMMLARAADELEHSLTLRDLIRAARAAGAPLRRYRADHIATEYWQCWDDGAHTRRAMVRHWPSDGMWRIEIYGRYDDPDGDHAVRVDLQSPTVEQIAAAARLCGWELGTS